MTQEELILACLTAGNGKYFDPVHIQKLVFMFQEQASQLFPEKKPFNFVPYDYGPFCTDVYNVLRRLAENGKVAIAPSSSGGFNEYAITADGTKDGNNIIASIQSPFKEYLQILTDWILPLTFEQLVSTVYKEFPHMKVRSVFNG